jgi:hypothetical protein
MSRISLGVLTDAVGTLSAPSKMPWYGYGLPATKCVTGSRLRKVAGSVCEKCYAFRGKYQMSNVQSSLDRRLRLLTRNPEAWAAGMARAIIARAGRFQPSDQAGSYPAFRWHDSGDLQGVWHLAAINAVAWHTTRVRLADGEPKPVKHWLPTREYGIVAEFFEGGGETAPNLNIRLSAHMIDGPPPLALALKYGLTVSTVHTSDDVYPSAHVCPAPEQGNRCAACRNCWMRRVKHVSYKKH